MKNNKTIRVQKLFHFMNFHYLGEKRNLDQKSAAMNTGILKICSDAVVFMFSYKLRNRLHYVYIFM